MLPEKITKSDLALVVGVSTQAIEALEKKNVIRRIGRGMYAYPQAVQQICAHYREIAAGRGGEEKQITLTSERARYAKEQADAVALKNSILRGEMVDASSVQKKWASIFSAIRSGILAITSELPSLLVHLTRHDIEVIDRAIRDALNKVADDIGADQ